MHARGGPVPQPVGAFDGHVLTVARPPSLGGGVRQTRPVDTARRDRRPEIRPCTCPAGASQACIRARATHPPDTGTHPRKEFPAVSDKSTTKPATGKTDSGIEAVTAAVGRLGGVDAAATAADIAADAGMAYSTTNKKLRALRDAGRAVSFDGPDNRTLWRLANATGTAVAAADQPDQDCGQTVPVPPPAEPAAAGPDVTVVPAQLFDQLTGEPTDATADTAVADLSDQRPEALDSPAGQSAVVPADAQAEPDDNPDDAEGGPVGPPEEEQPTGIQAGPSGTAGPDGAPAAPAAGAASHPDTGVATDQAPGRAADQPSAEQPAPATVRRAAGSLPGAILNILADHPDQQYSIGELCKLINEASQGTGVAIASRGAVANAATKLVGQRRVEQTVERPATYQLAPTSE